MPRKKKRIIDMTTEELAKKVFPRKKLRDKLKEIAHEQGKKEGDKNDGKE